eukprot:2236901-Amphidinium_carterae.1
MASSCLCRFLRSALSLSASTFQGCMSEPPNAVTPTRDKLPPQHQERLGAQNLEGRDSKTRCYLGLRLCSVRRLFDLYRTAQRIHKEADKTIGIRKHQLRNGHVYGGLEGSRNLQEPHALA